MLVPRSMRPTLLEQLHDSSIGGADLGIHKTLSKLRKGYYWPGYRQFVKSWCRSCNACAKRKYPRHTPRIPMVTEVNGYPFSRIALDIMGPLPLTEQGENIFW